jgi:hypothetical protein
MRRRQACFASRGDVRVGFRPIHNLDTATHLFRALACEGGYIRQASASVEAGGGGSLPLFYELILLSICTGKKIRTDHLQAISPGFITPQHEASRFDGFLDDGQLTLVKLEINNLPGLGFFTRKVPFDLALEAFLRHLFGLVQPGCTVEVIAISADDLNQLRGFAPADLTQLLLWDPG